MPDRSRSARLLAACRADFLWFGVFFVAAILVLDVAKDHWPLLYDTEYAVRLDLLRQRLAEAPERPLLLFVGSSRVGQGFHPEAMPEVRTADGQPVLAFTFSHLAGGPTMSLVQTRRLLREGIRPRWLLVELVPAILADESPSTPIAHSTAGDLPILFRYLSPAKVGMVYVRSRLNPWHSHRQELLETFAPALACPRHEADHIRLGPQGGDDYWFCPRSITPEEVRRRTQFTLKTDGPRLQKLRIVPRVDRALRELLDLCRTEGIEAVLVCTPESSEYRALYSAESQRVLADYAADLERAYRVPVVDARAWVPDDGFVDGHHQLKAGGIHFTRRLTAEVLRPLALGRLRPRADTAPAVARSRGISSRRE